MKSLVRLGIIAVVLLVPVFVVVYLLGGKKSTDTLFKRVTRQPITLVEETFDVPSKSWQGRGFTLNSSSEVTIDVEVTSGDGVNVYVIDSADVDKFKKATGALFGGQFQHYPALHSPKTKKTTNSARLGAGGYYLVIYNDTWGVLAQPKFTVRVKVTAL